MEPSAVLQRKMPVITQLLEPAHRLAEEITKIEKRVAEIKKNHPDFIMAFKLQILLRKYEEMMDGKISLPRIMNLSGGNTIKLV